MNYKRTAIVIAISILIPITAIDSQSASEEAESKKIGGADSSYKDVNELREKAEQGSADAQYRLGMMYNWGFGVDVYN